MRMGGMGGLGGRRVRGVLRVRLDLGVVAVLVVLVVVRDLEMSGLILRLNINGGGRLILRIRLILFGGIRYGILMRGLIIGRRGRRI